MQLLLVAESAVFDRGLAVLLLTGFGLSAFCQNINTMQQVVGVVKLAICMLWIQFSEDY